MNIHRARTDDDRTAQSSSGGTTVPPPEPAAPPAAEAAPHKPVAAPTVTPPPAPATPPATRADAAVATADVTDTTKATGTADPGAPVTKPTPSAAEEIDRLSRRMERALGGFVDDPRRAVREADAVLDEASRRLARVLAERRNSLRDSWHGDGTAGAGIGTEELRVALTKYRDMTRELLNVG